MAYTKTVKVYKQGGTSITLPTAFCELLQIQPGDKLELTLDVTQQNIIIEKVKDIKSYKLIKAKAGDKYYYICTNGSLMFLVGDEVDQFFKESENVIHITGQLDEINCQLHNIQRMEN